MSNSTPLKRRLSLFGLLIILVALTWLAVQVVQLFPNAASTVASLANSVYNYNPREVRDFAVTGPSSMVSTGEVFELSWPKLSIPGQYTFSYSCVAGVTANIKSESQLFTEANCDTSYDIGSVSAVELSLHSNQARFAEVDYKIGFFRTNATTPTAMAAGGLTVINPNLSLSGEPISSEVATSTPTSSTTTPSEIKPDTKPSAPTATSTPVTATSTSSQGQQATSSPASTSTKPPTPVLVPVVTYNVPISQADGFTDLAVSYLGVGSMAANGEFTNTGLIQSGTTGAIRFSVRNLGTRTSETWRYVAELPNGQTYVSPDQAPLKPNERATLTIGFNAPDGGQRNASFGVGVVTSRDTNINNNNFIWSTVVSR